MTTKQPDGSDRPRRPGDILLDRYFPDADLETRERAREAFRDFAHFLLRMGERLSAEDEEFRARWEEGSNPLSSSRENDDTTHQADNYFGA